MSVSCSSSSYDHQMCAAILDPGTLGVSGIERPFLAVADRAHPASIDAQGHEVFLGRIGAAIAQCQVVLFRSSLVTMAFDEQVVLGIPLQPVSGGRERRLCVR